jgi:hypothetical protein
VHDFNAFVNDYASITDMLKKGFPYWILIWKAKPYKQMDVIYYYVW